MDEQLTTPLHDEGSVEVIRSAERPVVGAVAVPIGRVRVAKRVVTEERTVTLRLRREELVVEQLPVGDATPVQATAGASGGTREALVVVLREEQPRVETVLVPTELVRVLVDRVSEQVAVATELAHEEVEVTGVGGGLDAGFDAGGTGSGRHRA